MPRGGGGGWFGGAGLSPAHRWLVVTCASSVQFTANLLINVYTDREMHFLVYLWNFVETYIFRFYTKRRDVGFHINNMIGVLRLAYIISD